MHFSTKGRSSFAFASVVLILDSIKKEEARLFVRAPRMRVTLPNFLPFLRCFMRAFTTLFLKIDTEVAKRFFDFLYCFIAEPFYFPQGVLAFTHNAAHCFNSGFP